MRVCEAESCCSTVGFLNRSYIQYRLLIMKTYYVVPDRSGYGDWAIKKKGGYKVSDAQTQSTAVNSVRNTYGTKGDQVYVYGSRKNEIVDSFTIS